MQLTFCLDTNHGWTIGSQPAAKGMTVHSLTMILICVVVQILRLFTYQRVTQWFVHPRIERLTISNVLFLYYSFA